LQAELSAGVARPGGARGCHRRGQRRVAVAGLAHQQRPGGHLALFGSATLTVSLLVRGLVYELRVMVNPILLGGGVSLFAGLKDCVRLTLLRTITFRSGDVLLTYRPAVS
jgi:dihydrofolate reductase